MKKLFVIPFVALLSLSLLACTEREQRTGTGALIGGAAGTAIGAASGGKAGGAIAGGLIGAAAGAIIADATRPTGPTYRDECVRTRRDAYGETYCTRYRRVRYE